MELGDCKLSQVLRHIQQLLGEKAATMNATFLRALFLQCLPANVRMVLNPLAGDLNLEQLAQQANRIMEASPILTIATTKTTTQLTAQVNELTCRLDELKTQMASTFSCCPANHPALHDRDSPWLPITRWSIIIAGITTNLGRMQRSLSTFRPGAGHSELPTTLQQPWEFLRLVNFYHRFIPQCADILTPLNTLLKTTLANN